MIVLGIYYIIKPFRDRNKNKYNSEQKDNRETEPLLYINTNDDATKESIDAAANPHQQQSVENNQRHQQELEHDDDKEGFMEDPESSVPPSWNSLSDTESCASRITAVSKTPTKGDLLVHDDLTDASNDQSTRSKWMTRLIAFIAGTFHGVAGPGGVLGVMIALKLNDWLLSSLYLLSFFVSSIITMGIFAIIYGFCTNRMALCSKNQKKCAFILEILSAVFSFSVGVLWLALLFTGKLDEWFD